MNNSFISLIITSILLNLSCRADSGENDIQFEENLFQIIEIQNKCSQERTICNDDPNVDFDTLPPVLGSQVNLRSVVVTAFDGYAEVRKEKEEVNDQIICHETIGSTGSMVVQDIDGGPWSGISLYRSSVIPIHQKIEPGDLVDVIGEYLEFCLSGPDSVADSYCAKENINRLTQLGNASVQKIGETTQPEPLEILLSDLKNPVKAEPYEGVLVRFNQHIDISPCSGETNCCVGDYDNYGNLCLGNRGVRGRCSEIEITNEFYSLPTGTTCVSSVTGIVTWFFQYRISPRGPEDVVIPTECRAPSR